MMQEPDYHLLTSKNPAFAGEIEKTTKKPLQGVGEEWPPLLSKKWMAIHFGCWNGREVLWRRFRTHVLTEEVLKRAGIDPEYAYSRHCKTFNAIDSLMLTKVLRGFCLLPLLFSCLLAQAQTTNHPQIQYSRDSTLRDTIPGQAMLTDSIVRMVEAGSKGEYRFEKVLSSVVVDAYMVKEYRFLMKASDGKADPFDFAQRFYYLTGGQIDPNRILIFKQRPK